jgi:hypothetical protein
LNTDSTFTQSVAATNWKVIEHMNESVTVITLDVSPEQMESEGGEIVAQAGALAPTHPNVLFESAWFVMRYWHAAGRPVPRDQLPAEETSAQPANFDLRPSLFRMIVHGACKISLASRLDLKSFVCRDGPLHGEL